MLDKNFVVVSKGNADLVSSKSDAVFKIVKHFVFAGNDDVAILHAISCETYSRVTKEFNSSISLDGLRKEMYDLDFNDFGGTLEYIKK